MCCPLTQATVTWLFSMLISVLSGTGSSPSASAHTTIHVPSSAAIHNYTLLEFPPAPFVRDPIPNQEITTLSDPLSFYLYDVFASEDNSRLEFRVTVTNDNIASAEISNDTLYVFPENAGTTRIRVTAEDSDDDEATDTFRLSVRENNAPEITQDFPIQDQTIIQGTSPFTLNLSSIFDDPDGDPLSFEVSSSDTEVSSPVIAQSLLIAPAESPGTTRLEITAQDPFGGSITIDFELEVLRPYPRFIETGFSVTFGSISASSSYRLVALPGNLSERIEDITEGEPGDDWIAYSQDSTGKMLLPYNTFSGFNLQPGNGIWFLSKNAWEIEPQNVQSVPLSQGGTYTIPLHDGWNIISNPFDIDLDWEEVSKWNGLSQILWSWDGSYNEANEFQSSAKEGQAYYYFNAENESSLVLPYPGLANPFFSKANNNAELETLSITARNEHSFSSRIRVGRSNVVGSETDKHDQYAPPSHFSSLELVVSGTDPSEQVQPLAQDIQPAQEEIYRFDLVLTTEDQDPVHFQIDDLDAFESEAITLVNLLDATTYNLHERNSIWLTPENEKTPFTLFIGAHDNVQEAINKINPLFQSLKQNYPNPVQSSTTIEFSLPDPQHATLSIYDAMGRLVKVVLDRDLDSGLHRVEWHGDSQNQQPLANGIYFYRLRTDGNTFHRKLVLLR